ncbi:alpha/beta hydrolase domain-containing protein [Aquabacterium sp.]|uniref:alpha/beta hydrolase domain-containing protein n=1 Tax=Aquabacterium sp. TaxID=1872578 RepID=UPI0019B5ECC8|nr:alpha/beta hydrolase domain-containing protein [Aquabacterium sp.]MBC7699196.1 hypothetical protein [Aquabacterium sp.]
MKMTPQITLRQCCLAALLACAGASSSIAAAPQAVITPSAATPGFGDRLDPVADSQFVEQEFSISGLARKYKGTGTLGADGKWAAAVVSSANPYNTLMIVRRPASAAQFNGIVIVEWLNVSTGYPLDVDWSMAHEAILREGYAYIGVNVQKVGVTGVQKLKQFGDRYAAMSIPDDDISYDILSQTAQAVRDQAAVLLGGLQPNKILATGHSQSAMRLLTYANAIQPLDNVFDGLLIHGRLATGAKLASADNLPATAAIRSDTKVPVFLLQTEMDSSLSSGTSKQIDTDKIRQWEVAGGSHADQYLLDNIGEVSGRDVGWVPPMCVSPYNAMPVYATEIAAFNHLKNWVSTGVAPPTAPRLQRDWLGSIKKDANGNALGGLRLPELDVPIAKYGHANFTTGSLAFLDLFACVAGGNTNAFDANKLKTLYPTHADYVAKYTLAASAALLKGYIRPVEYAKGIARAQAAKVPQ